MASVTLDKVADFDTQSQFQVDTWECSRDIRTDVPMGKKKSDKTTMLEFLKYHGNGNKQFQPQI